MDFENAAIVVAHPDDEIIWFASLVAKVRRVIICYTAVSTIPERAAQRRSAAAAYPLKTAQFLDMPEPGDISAEGDALHRRVLCERLSAILGGVTAVFTHSPWGEYGHADHRRLNGVVNALARDMNFSVYVPCYVARHRLGDFDRALNDGVDDVVSFPISQPDIDPIFALYKANACWTWAPHWRWPGAEHFIRLGGGRPLPATAIPLHLFDVNSLRPG